MRPLFFFVSFLLIFPTTVIGEITVNVYCCQYILQGNELPEECNSLDFNEGYCKQVSEDFARNGQTFEFEVALLNLVSGIVILALFIFFAYIIAKLIKKMIFIG